MIEKNSNNFISTLCDEIKKNNQIPPDAAGNMHVHRGLRNADGTGVLAGLTLVGNVRGYSVVDAERKPMEGKLLYRGIDVCDIVDNVLKEDRFGFEEVAYLLLFGTLPNAEELKAFNDLLFQARTLPRNFTEDMIIKAPSSNIMNKLGRSVLALYSYDESPDDTCLENVVRQSIELLARMPIFAAQAYHVKRHYYHNDSMYLHIPPEGLSTAETLLYCMRPDKTYTKEEARLLDISLILHAEHGGGNNSAFTCRVLSSSGTDTYSAVSAALGSLKGPLHGGANAQVRNMMKDIQANVRNWKDDDELKEYLRRILRKEVGDKSGKIYGMGHAVYTLSDPRSVLLKKCARDLAEKKGFTDRLDLLESVERLTPIVFAEEKNSNKAICSNIDLYSGLVYEMLGIPSPLYTPIFAIARTAGWCAHRIEELTTGGRIIRPGYKSIVPDTEYTPISERK